jgi:hypothetical protein
MLFVGVDGYRDGALDTNVGDPVHGVVSRATTTAY